MNPTSLRDALAPLAARMPRLVREHEILRIAATVHGKDAEKAAEHARKEILHWAQNRCGGRLPKEAWDCQDFEYLSGGRNSHGIRIETDAIDIWAVRAEDPDKIVPGRVWTTEVVIVNVGTVAPRFSIRLLVSTAEHSLDIVPHAPGFVQQVAEKCGLSRGLYELTPTPWLVESGDDADRLIEMLTSPDRILPVFILSVPEESPESHKALLDGQDLARACLGMAHIVVLPAVHSWVLTTRLGRMRSVFGGAVRAYLPGFNEDANPYSHRLLLADRFSTPGGVIEGTRWFKSMAAAESIRRNRLGTEILDFASIRSASLKLRQESLQADEASDAEQLEVSYARIRALETQVGEQKALQEYFDEEHKKNEARAETAEVQLRAANFRIQQLLDVFKTRGASPDENITLPKSWQDFEEWCDVHLAGRVVLSSRARGEIPAKFNDAPLVARCLLWLANECRDRRIHGGGALSEDTLEPSIRNSHCGGDAFKMTWQGQSRLVDWHIKNGGNTRDPARCLRIYYFWDEEGRQIVIAHMPSHIRTDAT